MSRPSANKVYKNFVAGLVTEASPLTYPENASIDEDNTVITRRGNRRRRLGVDYIDDHTLSNCGFDQPEAQSSAIQEFFWTNVANKNTLKFLVLQLGATLFFYDVSDGTRYPEAKYFSIDLSPFRLSNAPVSAAQIPVSMAAGRGSLFVTGEYFEPFSVDYDPNTDTINSTRIIILIRDFVGVDDGLATDEEPTTLTVAHNYNLFNQGWVDPSQTGSGTAVTAYDSFGGRRTRNQLATKVGAYHTALTRYPSNAQVWWGGKDAMTGDFAPTELVKQFFGNTRAPRGHYVVEAFNIDRDAVSGLSGVPGSVATSRPKSVGFFSGRVWWGHDNDVYFSRVLEDRRQAGNCYQEADPTSEYLSDLIESDGGQIPIPEAVDIERLVPFGDGILVFAANGVWNVRGTDAGFTARDYAVSKVSSVGLDSPESVVEAGDTIFWWSKIGIQAIKQSEGMFGPISGSFNTSNITETTIQTFYNNEIDPVGRLRVKGRYDPTNNTVQWLFNDGSIPGRYFYNRILNFDMTLEAFYPWTLARSNEAGPYLCGSYISQAINETRRNRLTRYIALVPDNGEYCVAFCEFRSFNFTDWDQLDPAPYESYLITGYELMEDAMRDKELSHIHTYFSKTETTFVDEGGGDYSVDRPSSCKFRVRWDWADSPSSGKWSREVEAYRHRRMPPVNTANLGFDTGSAIVISKNRIRGHGRAIQFKFSSDKVGHDFDLLGWAVQFTGNANV